MQTEFMSGQRPSEAELRQSGECLQRLDSGETAAHVELRALRFSRARAQLDRAPRCGRPPALVRTEIEAELGPLV